MDRLIAEGPDPRRLRLNLLRSHEEECSRLRAEILGLLPASRREEAPRDKTAIRLRHQFQRESLLNRMRDFLEEFEDSALSRIANGGEVNPEAIVPEVILARTEEQSRLFSYATLHWSVPVSGGY